MEKPGIALLIGKPKGAPEKAEPEAPEVDDQKEMQLSAMDDFISAVKDGDSEMALSAFQDLCSLCDYGDEEA